ncbi:LD-carboxypeptidase [Cytobacillus kochii]|uniref:S66 peptidase family protein n=1 Tax=Cytobacillus kochii TaxID=859143 RepID=UPI001CD56DFF|nr:LD-carboxypeptidase [Cytobacillus kochii]MCA1027975.1 LD-carboxypeptidase [Cytobacillus kochii]
MIIKPARLRMGDTVGVIAPASPPNQENLKRSFAYLEKELGLKIKLGQSLFEQYGYLAGPNENRLEDLHMMFADKEVKAIICAGGGYGTAKIADDIDYKMIAENPKVFWGYSDITFLHTAIRQKTGLVTFHGPMLASDIGSVQEDQTLSKAFMKQIMEPEGRVYPKTLGNLETVVSGVAEGDIVGGNLCLLTSTIGTAFEIDTKDKIILIEDIHEEPRSIDRMLNQLYMAGKLQQAAGFVIGNFKNCTPEREQSLSLDEVLDYYFKRIGKPTVKGFMIGHCTPHFSLPLGVPAKLNAETQDLTIEHGVL